MAHIMRVDEMESKQKSQPMNESLALGLAIAACFIVGPTALMAGAEAFCNIKDKAQFGKPIKNIMKILLKYKDDILKSEKCQKLKKILNSKNVNYQQFEKVTAYDLKQECEDIMSSEDYNVFCDMLDKIAVKMEKNDKRNRRYTLLDAIEDAGIEDPFDDEEGDD